VRGIGEYVNRRDFVVLDDPASSGQLPPEISYSQGPQASQEGISNGNQAENKRYAGRNVGAQSASRDSFSLALITRNNHDASGLSQHADENSSLFEYLTQGNALASSPFSGACEGQLPPSIRYVSIISSSVPG
jgi:hypothetical protein